MEERKEKLLRLVIETYVKTAEPIGSQFLIETAVMDVSGATVRNEMRELEEEGLLTHPHTSAGRIPTERGYIYYMEHLLRPVSIPLHARAELKKIEEIANTKKQKTRSIAKVVASYTNSAVIVAFGDDVVYYTGIGNLFSQPEFQNFTLTVDVSAMFDECEKHIETLLERMSEKEVTSLIGSQNPLGAECSVVGFKNQHMTLFSIFGPIRMNYAKNMSCLSYIQHMI
ncbi:MAG: hypothetical protein A3G08_04100 [Candidatus Magasanikbacteria bacterium RIFCSPLOWO2_12_FULL_47_9b]|nr:MAG: hypothetical protein A3I74_00920 [Candidatus Magasanikbacteria bacterium RIFCSPLOWO2_02_FULL_47_16]OGH79992.1 MAG: hypothetical protein A3C10_02305 [Candidatus Magasanikbacteria bacterium RIFCSPHIGHO2_02_FULL_48_18]OGH83479.1 MAG: hypothetical protein A3G08_04100 [Candidatus Magasanikbacteria bacterium RIFCSPLOWO2_12_FULL_47_9b]